jgi:LPXTG-site transpeptidase (sortase) family protein
MLTALVATLALVGCGAPASQPAKPAQQTNAADAAKNRNLPTWVDVSSIGAHSSLVQLGLNADKSVQVPPVNQPLQAGWYKYSPAPGQVGPSVILGHIDGEHRKGIFWKLRDVKPGDTVKVGRMDGSTVAFKVTKVDQVPKKSFPTDAVYGNTSDPEIRLITCGGVFDSSAHSYKDNIVVYGKQTSV